MYKYINSFISNSFLVAIKCFFMLLTFFVCRPQFTFLLKECITAYTVIHWRISFVFLKKKYETTFLLIRIPCNINKNIGLTLLIEWLLTFAIVLHLKLDKRL